MTAPYLIQQQVRALEAPDAHPQYPHIQHQQHPTQCQHHSPPIQAHQGFKNARPQVGRKELDHERQEVKPQ